MADNFDEFLRAVALGNAMIELEIKRPRREYQNRWISPHLQIPHLAAISDGEVDDDSDSDKEYKVQKRI